MVNNVIIFYEIHRQSEPTKVIINLIPFLSQHGLKTHCFEDPIDSNRVTFENDLKSTIFLRSEGLNIESLSDPYAQIVLKGRISQDRLKNLSKEEKDILIKMIKLEAAGYIESLLEALKLTKVMEENNIGFCTMDLPSNQRDELDERDIDKFEKFLIRDNYMTQSILKHLKKGDVSILVGAEHVGIASNLKASGVNVREYYIASEKIDPYIHHKVRADYCFRVELTDKEKNTICSKYKLDGLVIDLYDDPNINATNMVKNDLLGTIYDSHDL